MNITEYQSDYVKRCTRERSEKSRIISKTPWYHNDNITLHKRSGDCDSVKILYFIITAALLSSNSYAISKVARVGPVAQTFNQMIKNEPRIIYQIERLSSTVMLMLMGTLKFEINRLFFANFSRQSALLLRVLLIPNWSLWVICLSCAINL